MISWLVKPCRWTELATSRPSGSYSVRVQIARLRRDPAQDDVAAAVERRCRRRRCGHRTRRRRRSRPAARRCARPSRAHRDRCRACRSSARRSRRRSSRRHRRCPRVSASQVVPRPIAAAMVKANNDPKSRRTIDPIELAVEARNAHAAGRQRQGAPDSDSVATSSEGRARASIAAHLAVGRRLLGRCHRARLRGALLAPAHRLPRQGRRAAASARVASSISRSTRTSMSAPRRVNSEVGRIALGRRVLPSSFCRRRPRVRGRAAAAARGPGSA